MNFHILTLFPEMVSAALMTSITGRAAAEGKISIQAVNIRDFSTDRHKRVDDYPYGGGAGMLMQAQPVFDAFESVMAGIPDISRKRVIYVTPQGRPFTQQVAQELAQNEHLILLCGHYEGVDERVLEEIVTDNISIGDYVLTGGELAAMVIVDAVARLVPNVLHNEESAYTETFHGNLLEYPQYSRPEVWHGRRVPAVLLSGNRRKIDCWRRREAEARTAERRPDLYESYLALQACETLLLRDKLHHMDMLELIRRGRARLLARQGEELLLEDVESSALFHTRLGTDRREGAGTSALQWQEILRAHPAKRVYLHQETLVPLLAGMGYCRGAACVQCVCTRREQLPVRGLYGADGHSVEGRTIRFDGVCAAAFIDGEEAGSMRVQGDGSIGALTVLPQYRRRRVASALETFLCNQQIQNGMTPYGRIPEDNAAALALQESLGLYAARGRVYVMERVDGNSEFQN